MTTTPVSLQDLRRRIYVTAKADKTKRFWGLYVHVVRLETLKTAYALVKRNNGAPGIDGVTFAATEAAGVEAFLAQLQDELVARTYRPLRNRRVEIPKRGGKVRVLGIPALRDRVVQGALKLILEPIFEADFCNGSYGYRPRRTAHEAVARVDKDMVEGKTRVIDVDLAAYCDTVRHHLLLGKVARRIPGLRLPTRSLIARRLEGASDAEAYPADSVAGQAQGSVPTVSITTGRSDDRRDQPDPSGVGELLPDRERASVLCLCEAVGGAESAATFDEGEGP